MSLKSSKLSKMSPTKQVQKKHLTCYYWKTSKCKFQAHECQYMHEDTGKVAFAPKTNPKSTTSPAKKTDQNSSEVDDLISLYSWTHQSELKTDGTPSIGSSSNTVENQAVIRYLPRISSASIAHAISESQDYDFIENLLVSFSRTAVKEALASDLDSSTCLLAAVYVNSPEIVKLLVEYGANPNAIGGEGMPVLAYSIKNRSIYGTEILKTLLALGANPRVIPSQFWENSFNQQDKHGHQAANPEAAWCNDMYQGVLERFINIPMKYHLFQASKSGVSAPTSTKLRLSTFFVGQDYAIQTVKQYLDAYNVCKGNTPLVLAFIGPSGHGKRTLAQSIGRFHELSPSVASNTSPLLEKKGSQAPMSESDPDVFFIDGDNVDHSWLKAQLNRAHSDTHRDDNKTIKTKTRRAVYILSVTQSQDSTKRIYTTHGIPDEIPMGKELCSQLENAAESKLREELIQTYGPSISGQIQHIIPFIPFTKAECSVLAHQYLMQALQNLARDYISRDPSLAKHGHEICFCADDQVYEHLGSLRDPRLGVRSIERAVTTKAMLPIVSKYLAKVSENAKDFTGKITLVTKEVWGRQYNYELDVSLE